MLSVVAEYQPLLRAIVQPPGPAMERIPPDESHWYGYTDLCDLPAARAEHRALTDCLSTMGVAISRFDRMLYDVVERLDERERQSLIDSVLLLNPHCPPGWRRRLYDMHPARLTLSLINGVPAQGSLQQAVEGVRFFVRPLPNLTFVHDLCVVVGRRVVSGFMASPLRSAEERLMELLLRRHPAIGAWGDSVFWLSPTERAEMGIYDRREVALRAEARWARLKGTVAEHSVSIEADRLLLQTDELMLTTGPPIFVEGGDIMLLESDERRCLLVGVGRRTTPQAVDLLAERLLRHSPEDDGVDVFLVVVLPEREDVRALDTVLAAPHPDHLIVYAPVLKDVGRDTARFYTMTPHRRRPRARPHRDLETALRAALGAGAPEVLPLPPTGVSIAERLASEHAQWSGALNLLAVAPGRVLVFERAEALLRVLEEQRGYRILDHSCVNQLDFTEDQPVAITLPGGELSRAGGGPRSLVLPLERRHGGST